MSHIIDQIDTSHIDLKLLKKAYGSFEGNWGDLNIFQGDYVNFGYWKDINFTRTAVSPEMRTISSLNLYLYIAKFINIHATDSVLEVGCGRGMGAIHLFKHFAPKLFNAVDVTPAQIDRSIANANDLIRDQLALRFSVQNSESLSFSNDYFDKIYSIGMLQHLDSPDRFTREMRRVLKSNGRLVLSTFLPTCSQSVGKVIDLLSFYSTKTDNPTPIEAFEMSLRNNGFTKVDIHAIGKHVFLGYEKWARQVNAINPSTFGYLTAFNHDLLDYFVIVAE